MRQAVRLCNERPLLKRVEGDLAEASLYQLVIELDAAGWKHEVVTPAQHKHLRKERSPHLQEQQKAWYTLTDARTVRRSCVVRSRFSGGTLDMSWLSKRWAIVALSTSHTHIFFKDAKSRCVTCSKKGASSHFSDAVGCKETPCNETRTSFLSTFKSKMSCACTHQLPFRETSEAVLVL